MFTKAHQSQDRKREPCLRGQRWSISAAQLSSALYIIWALSQPQHTSTCVYMYKRIYIYILYIYIRVCVYISFSRIVLIYKDENAIATDRYDTVFLAGLQRIYVASMYLYACMQGGSTLHPLICLINASCPSLALYIYNSYLLAHACSTRLVRSKQAKCVPPRCREY